MDVEALICRSFLLPSLIGFAQNYFKCFGRNFFVHVKNDFRLRYLTKKQMDSNCINKHQSIDITRNSDWIQGAQNPTFFHRPRCNRVPADTNFPNRSVRNLQKQVTNWGSGDERSSSRDK